MKRLLRKLLVFLLLIGLVAAWLMIDRMFPPEILSAPTASVRDGDTLLLGRQRFRLHGIDAPEYRQTCTDSAGKSWPCGRAARAQLEALVLRGPIACEVQATDQFQRKVAICTNGAGVDLGRAMVEAGLAISPASRGTAPYADEEDAASEGKRGIWAGPFDRPADWRAAHPRGEAAY